MDVSQYLEIFIDETKEHVQNLNSQILELEQDPENADVVNEIFRAAHSLKGMAGTMGFVKMQKLTHTVENVLSEIRAGNLSINSNMVVALQLIQLRPDGGLVALQGVDLLLDLLGGLGRGGHRQDAHQQTQQHDRRHEARQNGNQPSLLVHKLTPCVTHP